MDGYDVYLTRSQLDEAVSSATTPTRLIRNLMMIFFTLETLANSSAFGNRNYKALDKMIITACLSEFLF